MLLATLVSLTRTSWIHNTLGNVVLELLGKRRQVRRYLAQIKSLSCIWLDTEAVRWRENDRESDKIAVLNKAQIKHRYFPSFLMLIC